MDRRKKQNNIKKTNKISLYNYQNGININTLEETEQYIKELKKVYKTKNRLIRIEYSNGTIVNEIL